MSWLQTIIMLLGRICLAALFFYGVYEIAAYWDITVGMYRDKGMIQPQLIVFFIILIQLFAAISLLIGWKIRIGAFLLLLIVSFKMGIFYDFWHLWSQEPNVFNESLKQFAIGLGIAGGLLYVLACGAGCCSCDYKKSKKMPAELEVEE